MKIIIPYLEKSVFAPIAKKHSVSMIGYPISNYIKNNRVHIIISGFFQGKDKDIQKLVKEIKKDKRFVNITIKNNFVISETTHHISNRYIFTPGVFHVKPSIVNKEGEHIFEIAAWEKKILDKIFDEYHNFFNAKLIFMKKADKVGVQTINISPNLTQKQKDCLHLAINNHYYDYPRKITLKELAKLSRLSYSTYQFHLQNAEKKVMPFLDSLI